TVYRTTNGGTLWQKVFVQEYGAAGYNVVNRVWTDTEWGAGIKMQGLCVNDTDGDQAMVACVTGAFLSDDAGSSWEAVHAPAMVGSQQPSGNMPVMAILGYYFDPHDTNRHYMAGNDFSGWRSLDQGASWLQSTTGNPWPNNVYEMALDPDVPGRIWAAAAVLHDLPHWNNLDTYGNGGVVVSDDYGATWSSLGGGLPTRVMTDVFIEPGSPVGSRHLWAAAFGLGAYYSSNGGSSWTQQNSGFSVDNENIFKIRRDAHGRLLALSTLKKDGSSGFYAGALYARNGSQWEALLSNEGWKSYSAYQFALGDLPTHLTEFAVDPGNSNVVYVSALPPQWNEPGGGVWKTADGGGTWNQCFWLACMAVRVDPQDSSVVYASTYSDGLYISHNGGGTWNPVNDFPSSRPYRMFFDPSQPDVAYATSFGCMVWKGNPKPFKPTTTSVYIDFGDTLSVTSPDPLGRHWNEAGSAIAGGGMLADLNDKNGVATTIDLNVTGGFSADSQYGYDQGNTASSVVDWPVEASGDTWEVKSSSVNTLRLEGLMPNGSYDLTFYGGRFPSPGSSVRDLTVTIGTDSTVLDTAGEEAAALQVKADAYGYIDISFSESGTDGVAHLDAMSIEYIVSKPFAKPLYIDFGDNLPVANPDAGNRYWNAADGNIVFGGVLPDLVDEDNAATTVDLWVTGGFTGDSQYGYDLGNTASSVVDWPTFASGDTWEVTDASENTIRFEGLTPGALYELTFYGGRYPYPSGQVRDLTVTIGANSVVLDTAREDAKTLYVQAGPQGVIAASFRQSGTAGVAHFNAMRLSPGSVGDLSIIYLSGGGSVAISWNTDDWGTYALQAKTNLVEGSDWTDEESGIDGTGGSVSVTTAVGQAQSFYRAVKE
ncbi:MAG: hypothetical protein ABFR33_04460, partial [Verrucomicrobiota bacterium]